MTLYEPGDLVEIDINSGLGIAPLWIPAVVTSPTDALHGWTPAKTEKGCSHPGISRGPGWNQDEIRRRAGA